MFKYTNIPLHRCGSSGGGGLASSSGEEPLILRPKFFATVATPLRDIGKISAGSPPPYTNPGSAPAVTPRVKSTHMFFYSPLNLQMCSIRKSWRIDGTPPCLSMASPLIIGDFLSDTLRNLCRSGTVIWTRVNSNISLNSKFSSNLLMTLSNTKRT